MVDAARRGDLDVLWSSGGNFLDVLPAPDVDARRARRARRCACTRTSCSRAQMLVDPGDTVVLLPPRRATNRRAAARRPRPSAASRSVPSSPVLVSAKRGSEWRIFADVARRVRPERAEPLRLRVGRRDPRRDRARRAVVRGDRAPAHDGRRDPDRRRAPVRGRRVPDAPTAGPGSASVVARTRDVPEGRFVLSTRRGKQFNTMVWNDVDPLTGAGARRGVRGRGRRRGARRRGTATRSWCDRRTASCTARVHVAAIRPGNVQAFFPEANVLLAPARRDPISGVFDDNDDRRGAPRPMTLPRHVARAVRRHGDRRPRRGAVRSLMRRAARPHRWSRASTRSISSPTRRRVPCCATRRGAHRQRGVGRHEHAGADDHGGHRSHRRVHELLARHRVLVHVVLRARRRRPGRRARREPATGYADDRDPRAAARSATASGCTPRPRPASTEP